VSQNLRGYTGEDDGGDVCAQRVESPEAVSHTFPVTLWRNLRAKASETHDLSGEDLAGMVAYPLDPPCETLDVPWIKDWKVWGALLWTPTTFAGRERTDANAVGTCALVLDFDEPHADSDTWLATIGAVLSGDYWLAHTSVSSSPDGQKWRLIVPLREPLTPVRWKLAHARLRRLIEAKTGFVTDANALNVSRGWVRPIKAPGGFYVFHVEPGETVDGEALAAAEGARLQSAPRSAPTGKARAGAFSKVGHPTQSFREEDYPVHERISRAEKYLANVPSAIEGSGGEQLTWSLVLAVVHGFANDGETAFGILEPWNLQCLPPWPENKLRRKINEAATKATLPRGYLLPKGGRYGN
jgi:hypothetical protein